MDTNQDGTAVARLEQGGATLAYCRHEGSHGSGGPGVIFLGGFRSDMTGTKALALESWCRSRGRAFLRFDYTGHGQSSGAFEDGTIGAWAGDALAALDRLTAGPQILVGSSMGGWIALLTALARPERIAGLVGIAAAPDFTEDLMWARFDAAQRERLETEGVVRIASDYDPAGYPITRTLIEDGRRRLLLRGRIPLTVPVRLFHGMQDADVPWQTALRLTQALDSTDLRLILIKDGDHRLSRDADIALVCAVLEEGPAGA